MSCPVADRNDRAIALITLFPQERLSSAAKILLDASSVPRMAHSFEYFADFLYEPPALPGWRSGVRRTAPGWTTS